jgi:hypothetical protein
MAIWRDFVCAREDRTPDPRIRSGHADATNFRSLGAQVVHVGALDLE